MQDFPFFTILTASLNSILTIEQTLISIERQSFSSIEHIVVDGSSSDGTRKILKSYENRYNLIWTSEPDTGIANALNKGLSIAKGKYIIVIHADDQLVDFDTMQNAFFKLKNEEFDIFSFPVIFDHRFKGRILRKPISVLWWYHFKTVLPHQGSFVHRRVFDRIGGFRERFSIALDYDFFYRALQFNARIRFENRPVSIMGGDGVSNNPKFLNDRLREEFLIQKLNEKTIGWKMAQFVFQKIYYPYKTKLLPRFLRRRSAKAIL